MNILKIKELQKILNTNIKNINNKIIIRDRKIKFDTYNVTLLDPGKKDIKCTIYVLEIQIFQTLNLNQQVNL